MLTDNILLDTDSYKVNHWNQYPKDTEVVYSYFEARKGARFDKTVFFGLQPILRSLAGKVVTQEGIEEASALAEAHFGSAELFNRAGWQHILDKHDGRLPLRVRAVPEGTPVSNNNVLMTVENTDPACFWLTNFVESKLTHVWYPSTVASLSRDTKECIANMLAETADPEALGGIGFMLHDFGYRGATTDAAAAIGGAAHLVNFVGTDTLPAMRLAVNEYKADLGTLGFSVPATEHSVMTARGRDGEAEVVDQLLSEYPAGILSVVSDSYDIYSFVESVGRKWKDRILARDGVFVVRPDSCTDRHGTPAALTVWIARQLWDDFGGSVNKKGYKVLNPKVRILWGDGIDREGVALILRSLASAGFSSENMVFGMGGGLLQKVNRDTQRFAFKASAIKRSGEWHEVQKTPLDTTKASKPGRLRLTTTPSGAFETRPLTYPGQTDVLQTVFENGELLREQTFEDIRKRATV